MAVGRGYAKARLRTVNILADDILCCDNGGWHHARMPDSSTTKRPLWPRVRRVAETVLFIIGIPTAIVTFVALLPQAWAATHVHQVDASLLRGLHVGYSTDYVRTKLGAPTLQRSDGDYVQRAYLRDEWSVLTVSDKASRVVALAVLACGSGFQPSFDTPGNTVVTLNSSTMRESETHVKNPVPPPVGTQVVSPRDAEAASVGYFSMPGSNDFPALVTKVGARSAAGASGGSYLFGVSGVCASDTDYFGKGDNLAFVDSREVVKPSGYPSVRSYLATHRPNFYAEAVASTLGLDSTSGYPCFALYEDDKACVLPTIQTFQLPSSVLEPKGSHWWQNLW
ncbi:ETEC_3214 domain-containing protein [Leifsonia xyli]|uniref:ETEC_3214 domain-containing protein n=1 Tax=Leifsonia xyli TaxID=1575 RepID=UPI003D66C696